MSEAITPVPRLVRFSVVLALGVAAPVAVIRAAPDLPRLPPDHSPAAADDLKIGLSAPALGGALFTTLSTGATASAATIVADVLEAPLHPQAQVAARPAATSPTIFRTATTRHTTTSASGRHRSPVADHDTETSSQNSSPGRHARAESDDPETSTTVHSATAEKTSERSDDDGGSRSVGSAEPDDA